MGGSKINKAIFLDRDGVINKNIFNKNTGEFESPHRVKDFKIFPWVIDSLKTLEILGYKLFLISNQPSYAKGKTSLKNIKDIHKKLHGILIKNKIKFIEYFYCYHHPKGVVKKYSIKCKCRKPSPYFLNLANKKYNIDLSNSWIVGDRDTDVECGIKAGVKTILIKTKEESMNKKAGKSKPFYKAKNLKDAVKIIKKNDRL
jgi:D-glycero-D-manno-heptose 1,7-bisphosphate phosphatase